MIASVPDHVPSPATAPFLISETRCTDDTAEMKPVFSGFLSGVAALVRSSASLSR